MRDPRMSLRGRFRRDRNGTGRSGSRPLLLFPVRLADGGGGDGAAAETGEDDDGKDVGHHLQELLRDQILRRLDGYGLGEAEEQGGSGGADRVPTAEDERSQRDKAAPTRHVLRKGGEETHREVDAAQGG